MKTRVGIGLLLVAAAAAALYWWWADNQAPVDESTLLLYGNVDIREVRLAFNGSEHVAEILVDEVKKRAQEISKDFAAALKRAQRFIAVCPAETTCPAGNADHRGCRPRLLFLRGTAASLLRPRPLRD